MSPEARQKYERQYVTVTDTVTVSSGNSVSSYQLERGMYRQSVKDTDFLRLVGRTDVAQRFERLRQVQLGVMALGALTFVAGILVEGHESNKHSSGSTAGRLGIGGGTMMLAASLFISPEPLPAPEMRELADKYNRNLRQRLSEGGPQLRPARRSVDLAVVPYARPGGAGMLLTGGF